MSLPLLALVHANPAHAGASADAEQFEPAFFSESHPQSVLDMVLRLPGFTIEGGDKVRGLDGSVPNVLIDGKPVISRSESVNAILSRIPAENVVRIDIYRAEVDGINLYGYPEVANIVRAPEVDGWAALKLGSTLRNGYVTPSVNLDGEIGKGEVTANGSLSYYRGKGLDTNGGIAYLDPSRAPLSGYDLRSGFRSEGVSASMRVEYAPSSDVSIKGNASLSHDTSDTRLNADPVGPVLAYESISATDDEYRELGLEVAVALAANTDLKANLLHTFGTSDYSEDYSDESYSGATDGTSDFSETIASLSIEHRAAPNLSLLASVEGAFNRLDQSFRLFYDGEQFLLPFDEMKIDEDRMLATVRSVWSPEPLTILAELQWEKSQLRSVADEGSRTEDFSFLKPRLSLTYAPDPKTTLRLVGRRNVEQLNLGEFAATASVANDMVNAGNGAIRPESSWLVSFEVKRRFWQKGVFSLELVASRLKDVIDFRPGPDGFEIVGNIGDGHARHINAALDLPLDRFGLANTLLRTQGDWRDSSVLDPVTGQYRRLAGEARFDGDISLIKDFPDDRLTLQAEFNFARNTRTYRLREATQFHKASRIQLSAKYQPQTGVAIESTLDFTGGDDVSERERFIGTRNGELNLIEVRRTSPYVSVGLSLRISS